MSDNVLPFVKKEASFKEKVLSLIDSGKLLISFYEDGELITIKSDDLTAMELIFMADTISKLKE